LRLVKNIGQKKSQTIIDWIKSQPAESVDLEKWPNLGKRDEGLKALAGLLKELFRKGYKAIKGIGAGLCIL
jgi:hypothetical protein